MGLYINLEAVRVRLIGKVRFTEDENEENKMHVSLANRLVNEAEGQVELDCSPRYSTPFVTVNDEAFAKLPERPTKEILRTLCEIQSVMMILDTDFGRGTVSDSDKYVKNLKTRYDDLLKRLMAKKTDKGEESAGWKYPPLIGLQLNYFNRVHDDGYMGTVLTTSDGQGGFPAQQINNPGETWWTGLWGSEQ